jgi:hypothetical protein
MKRSTLDWEFNAEYFFWRDQWEECAHADGTDLRRSDLLGLYLMGGEL